jgi:pimeloyl-ACP methyl ester carboxylesterase
MTKYYKLIFVICSFCIFYGCGFKGNSTKPQGDFFQKEGLNFYYEISGKGEPLILIHGNSGGLASMKNQTDYFSQYYSVIAMDCRGRGKSELGPDSLTYEQMSKDVSDLMDHLKLDSALVIGYSDGGIVGLLLAMNHPEKVKKMAIFGTNIQPDSAALNSESIKHVHEKRLEAEAMLAKGDATENWNLKKQRYRLMEFQPNIKLESLKSIKAPVLVMSCEGDDIKRAHTQLIHQNIQGSELIIFPGEDHKMIVSNPKLFNSTVADFFEKR